jgi:hypothetical protein
MFNNFFSENRALYEIMWKNMVESDRALMTIRIIRRMRFACWINKATGTHSEYVILIAFPRQQRLRERTSILRYTYVACLQHSIERIKFTLFPRGLKMSECIFYYSPPSSARVKIHGGIPPLQHVTSYLGTEELTRRRLFWLIGHSKEVGFMKH